MALPATSTLCGLFTFLLAGSPMFYTPAPRGTCSNCCEIRHREDIQFLLYTRQNPTKAQGLYLGDDRRLFKSNLNLNNRLVIYIHGFSESAFSEIQSSQKIKNEFLKAGNYNVILIDWSPISAMPWYSNAVENLPIVARYISRFVRFLITSGYQAKSIHLIGFSLGAEVSGFIGNQLQEWGIKLPRITGLDPALPLFEDGSSNRRLGPKDARFVDIIHTDGGLLGNPEAMGHADFYPNGGRPLQPGCARQEIANNRWLGIIIGCSHQRAWEYFIESIKWPEAFTVNRCEPSKLFSRCRNANGRAFMGMGADRRLRGNFYLDTNDAPPFGRNAQKAALIVQRQQQQQLVVQPTIQNSNKNSGSNNNNSTVTAAVTETNATATAADSANVQMSEKLVTLQDTNKIRR